MITEAKMLCIFFKIWHIAFAWFQSQYGIFLERETKIETILLINL